MSWPHTAHTEHLRKTNKAQATPPLHGWLIIFEQPGMHQLANNSLVRECNKALLLAAGSRLSLGDFEVLVVHRGARKLHICLKLRF
jgi:hypothetical protein